MGEVGRARTRSQSTAWIATSASTSSCERLPGCSSGARRPRLRGCRCAPGRRRCAPSRRTARRTRRGRRTRATGRAMRTGSSLIASRMRNSRSTSCAVAELAWRGRPAQHPPRAPAVHARRLARPATDHRLDRRSTEITRAGRRGTRAASVGDRARSPHELRLDDLDAPRRAARSRGPARTSAVSDRPSVTSSAVAMPAACGPAMSCARRVADEQHLGRPRTRPVERELVDAPASGLHDCAASELVPASITAAEPELLRPGRRAARRRCSTRSARAVRGRADDRGYSRQSARSSAEVDRGRVLPVDQLPHAGRRRARRRGLRPSPTNDDAEELAVRDRTGCAVERPVRHADTTAVAARSSSSDGVHADRVGDEAQLPRGARRAATALLNSVPAKSKKTAPVAHGHRVLTGAPPRNRSSAHFSSAAGRRLGMCSVGQPSTGV